jgi:far upstream element-binding protein
MPGTTYPPQYGPGPPGGAPNYSLPQPISSGSVDLSSIKPVSSGSVSIADAIAKARGFAAEKGVAYDTSRGMNSSVRCNGISNSITASPRNPDPRMSGRAYRRSRSPSRTPPRAVRESFRDNYNPYRDERRGANDRGYTRDRSLSPRPAGRFSPPGAQGYPSQEPRSPPGRSRGAEGDTETIPIEKSLVGLIIGRSGENLRRVESTTGARVQFMDGPESGGSTRHCKISGGRAARAAAKAEIYRIIDENGNGTRGSNQDYSRGQPKAPSSTNSKDGENSQIMVPDRTVGLIIGRGGETIRDLQERSGCHVNIVGENKSINGLRPVNLIGSVQAQQRAKDLIMEIVESDTKNMGGKGPDGGRHLGRDDPYAGGQDKVNDSIMVLGEAVGMIIGKGMLYLALHFVAAF